MFSKYENYLTFASLKSASLQEAKCPVPFCLNIKQKLRQQQLQQRLQEAAMMRRRMAQMNARMNAHAMNGGIGKGGGGNPGGMPQQQPQPHPPNMVQNPQGKPGGGPNQGVLDAVKKVTTIFFPSFITSSGKFLWEVLGKPLDCLEIMFNLHIHKLNDFAIICLWCKISIFFVSFPFHGGWMEVCVL